MAIIIPYKRILKHVIMKTKKWTDMIKFAVKVEQGIYIRRENNRVVEMESATPIFSTLMILYLPPCIWKAKIANKLENY